MTEELMLGNWIMVNGVPQEVESLCFLGINQEYVDWDRTSWKKNLSPIPLSSEVLMKGGFTKSKHSNEYWSFWLLPNHWRISQAHHTEPSAGVEEGKFYYGDDYTEVKSLHHLQNLYFVLVGKQLEIKL